MQVWQQVYDPIGNIWLSSLIAALPILFFFYALIKLKLKGYIAATITVGIALLVALFFYKMPADRAFASVIYGFFYGLWPIAWIIIAAVFVYKISVKTGQFDIIRSSILSITPDQRLQMLIVGFCFGAFLEGAAGFGAPVAITAALLVGLGFNPLYAAGLCLIVNTAPVAFGAMGIPIIVAGQVTGLDSFEIGQMVGRQLPFLTIIVLFWIMAIMDGWRGIKETWPAVVVAGGSFAVAQYLSWVDKIKTCQWKRSYHNGNLNTVSHKNGAVRLCWSCDNLHHDQFHPSLGDIAETNRAEWLVDSVRRSLGFNEGHQLTLPELGWWAFLNGLTHLLPTSIAYRVTKTPEPPAFVGGVMKEADINPWQPDPDKVLSDLIVLAKPIIKLAGDEAPPASFMLKPKLQRWECEKYTRWVKTQKCCGCNKPADDPHHVINHGLGGMGTKTHDLFVLPLCRRCHDKLHKDVATWEQKHGDQRFLLIEFLNYALGVGAIFQA